MKVLTRDQSACIGHVTSLPSVAIWRFKESWLNRIQNDVVAPYVEKRFNMNCRVHRYRNELRPRTGFGELPAPQDADHPQRSAVIRSGNAMRHADGAPGKRRCTHCC